MKYSFLIIVAVVLAGAVSVGATGETGAQFLNIGVGTKATAMGNSFVGSADDPSAIYWNPAGMAQFEYFEIMATQNFWIEDMGYQFIGAVIPTDYGSIGASFAYSSSGDIPKYENYEYLGDFSAYDMVATIAYAFDLGEFIALGGSAKIIQQKIEEESSLGYAFDIGIHKYFGDSRQMRFGFVIQNIGPDIKFIEETDPLPFKIKGGVALELNAFSITSDITSSKDEEVKLNFGGQLLLSRYLALRAGYSAEERLTAGAGITINNMEMGFSYIPMDDLGSSTILSLVFKF